MCKKCTCNFGELINCCRQRHDYLNGLSEDERKKYIDAVFTISTDVKYKARYDKLIRAHGDLFHKGIHKERRFLPWHRYYIWQLEQLLQEVDCTITVPYWRWSLDSAKPFESKVWDSKLLGENGDPAKARELQLEFLEHRKIHQDKG